MIDEIKTLARRYGTPFYVFDEKGFVDNYIRLSETFKSIYPGYQISYSYKTNYTPYICQLVKRMGGYAEVVSDMEYMLAKKLGYSNDRIVYNGPSKGKLAYTHLCSGGILNIDSLDEARNIKRWCDAHAGRRCTCGIRINLDLGGGFVSRFGMEAGSKDFNETLAVISSTPNLGLVGLHCHISRHRGLEAWAERARLMLDAADQYIDGAPKYISLGSGMFADMPCSLREQFGGDSVPSYADYAEVAIRPFAEHYKGSDKKPILFTEPGTTVVARYLSFVSKVLSIKEIRGRYIANMDGDYHNLGEICTMKQLPVRVIAGDGAPTVYDNLDIMGFTCLEQDLMYPGFDRALAVGDLLVFENVGGYSIVSKPQFIKPQSAMFALRSGSSSKMIMRPETFDDVFSKFDFNA